MRQNCRKGFAQTHPKDEPEPFLPNNMRNAHNRRSRRRGRLLLSCELRSSPLVVVRHRCASPTLLRSVYAGWFRRGRLLYPLRCVQVGPAAGPPLSAVVSVGNACWVPDSCRWLLRSAVSSRNYPHTVSYPGQLFEVFPVLFTVAHPLPSRGPAPHVHNPTVA
jgi:hypothetical protein